MRRWWMCGIRLLPARAFGTVDADHGVGVQSQIADYLRRRGLGTKTIDDLVSERPRPATGLRKGVRAEVHGIGGVDLTIPCIPQREESGLASHGDRVGVFSVTTVDAIIYPTATRRAALSSPRTIPSRRIRRIRRPVRQSNVPRSLCSRRTDRRRPAGDDLLLRPPFSEAKHGIRLRLRAGHESDPAPRNETSPPTAFDPPMNIPKPPDFRRWLLGTLRP
jgi:hypothetical protein